MNVKNHLLFPERKLVALDFDDTLTCHKVYGRQDFDRLEYIFGGRERIEKLQNFLSFLHDTHAVTIIIVSWNWEEIIREAISAPSVFRNEPNWSSRIIHSIYDRNYLISYGGHWVGKRNLMNALCKKWHLDPQNVVFVDDSPTLLKDMNCHTVLVPEKHGIQQREMRQISTLLGFESPI
jgi:predicted enzyme involved in methoxymalonyl-ACP biosynthesis